jgi:epoxyqueuosine reductase
MEVDDAEQSRIESGILTFLRTREVGLFGFADLSPLPAEERYGFPRSISLGYPISKEILRGIRSGPTPEYYAEYDRLNALLIRTAGELEGLIVSRGYRALALEGAARCYDARALATALPHKTSASLSGLGWIGKCDLLVTEKFGSALRLSTVLTDAPLAAGTPVIESSCGACESCVHHCPAGAISGRDWSRGMEREELYDAFACQSTAKKLSDSIGAGHSICGICIANCPRTMRYAESP